MKPTTNALREGVKGQRVAPLAKQADAQPKAKKGYKDEDYHGFFPINGKRARFSTYRGRRYVQAQDVADEKFLTTIGGAKP
jgi:hypothetical protein